MNLIDIGANLTHQSFARDFEKVIADAQAAGLVHIILTGTDLDSSRAAQRMAQQRPQFFSSTAGFHPHVAANVSEADMAALRELAQQEQVVAIGETGLDFNRNYSPSDQQLSIFEKHLELAVELQKPVFLHQRDAHQAFLPILREFRPDLAGGVVHCFTDSGAALEDYLLLDMYIGITGWICDERRGQELQALVRHIPLERLLVETDAPYLLPRSITPKPGSRRNEPRFLPEVVRCIAQHSDQDPAAIAAASTSNAISLFRLPRQLAA